MVQNGTWPINTLNVLGNMIISGFLQVRPSGVLRDVLPGLLLMLSCHTPFSTNVLNNSVNKLGSFSIYLSSLGRLCSV